MTPFTVAMACSAAAPTAVRHGSALPGDGVEKSDEFNSARGDTTDHVWHSDQ
jgi:hypothetical protein